MRCRSAQPVLDPARCSMAATVQRSPHAQTPPRHPGRFPAAPRLRAARTGPRRAACSSDRTSARRLPARHSAPAAHAAQGGPAHRRPLQHAPRGGGAAHRGRSHPRDRRARRARPQSAHGAGGRPRLRDPPARPDRRAHPRSSTRRHHAGRLRRADPQAEHPVPRHPRDRQRAHGAGERIHRDARPRDRGRHVRRRRLEDGDRARRSAGPTHVRRHPRLCAHRDVSAARLLVGAEDARGRADHRRPGQPAQSRPRGGEVRRRLDQVLFRPPLLPHRRPEEAAALVGQLHRRRDAGAGRRGAPHRQEGRGPRHRLGRDRRLAARGGGQHRARRRPHRRPARADGREGRLLVPDHLRRGLRRRGPGRHLAAHGAAREGGLRPRAREEGAHRLRHRRGRLRLDREPGQGALLHGPLRNDADGGPAVGHPRRLGAARPGEELRHPGGRQARRRHRRGGRHPERHLASGARALRDEGRRDLPQRPREVMRAPPPESLRERARLTLGYLKTAPRVFALVRDSSRAFALGVVLVLVGQAALPGSMAWVGKLIVDAVVQSARTGSAADRSRVLELVALEFGLMVVSTLLSRAQSLLRELLRASLGNHVNTLIIEKATRLELRHLEDADLYDKMQNARREASTRPLSLVLELASLAQHALMLVSYAVLLARLSWWSVLVIALASLPAFVAEARLSGEAFRLNSWRAPEGRRHNYLEWILTRDSHVKEVKLFGLAEVILARYRKLYDKFYSEDRALAVRRAVTGLVLGALSLAAFYGSYAAMASRAARATISLGDLTLYLSLFRLGQMSFQSLLSSVASLYEDGLFVSNLFTYLDIPTEGERPRVQPPSTVPRGRSQLIEFREVGFRYPGAQRWALHRLSLRIEPGEKLALVGDNGAGKSTLIKLLLRLYEPTEGAISYGGVDLRDFDPADLRSRVGILFQD